VILNLAVVLVPTPLFNAIASRRPRLDETRAADYFA
jgi:hypothetical protein